MESKKRVFLSYSSKDREKVERIAQKLIARGIEIYNKPDDHIKSAKELRNYIQYEIQSSEAVLIFLSQDYNESSWHGLEISEFLKEFHRRNITVIPIIFEKTFIPSDLLEFEIFNLSNNFEVGTDKIINKLKVIDEITFENFTPREFENLIADLLKEFDFKKIRRNERHAGNEIDFIAEYEAKSPFGKTIRETWIVETKLYRSDRISIASVRELLAKKSNMKLENIKLLLVTNSVLTSATQNYLDDLKKGGDAHIEVIDGVVLKQLIAKHRRLLDKYFKA